VASALLNAVIHYRYCGHCLDSIKIAPQKRRKWRMTKKKYMSIIFLYVNCILQYTIAVKRKRKLKQKA